MLLIPLKRSLLLATITILWYFSMPTRFFSNAFSFMAFKNGEQGYTLRAVRFTSFQVYDSSKLLRRNKFMVPRVVFNPNPVTPTTTLPLHLPRSILLHLAIWTPSVIQTSQPLSRPRLPLAPFSPSKCAPKC